MATSSQQFNFPTYYWYCKIRSS